MSLVLNMVGGGAGSDVFAFILATYPVGSICSATNGTETLSASDTSGFFVFKILTPVSVPETWTVTSTDGEETASIPVVISTEGQSESVTLSYAEPIYYQGDEIVSITGGWALAPRSGYNGVLTKNATNMVFETSYVSGSHFAYGFLRANNQISLADYNTIRIKVTAFSNSNPSITPCYILARTSDNADLGATGSPSSDIKQYAEIDGVGTFDLDVSTLPDSYYIGVGCGHGSNNSAVSVTISEISLI